MKKKHFSLILIVGLSVMLLLSIGAGFLVGYFFVRGMWAVSVPVFIALAILLTIVLVIIREKYNYAMLVPLARLKVRLRTINTGQFEKISISKENAEMLPIVN
jgi:xanthosine utilization system XapX-like protein